VKHRIAAYSEDNREVIEESELVAWTSSYKQTRTNCTPRPWCDAWAAAVEIGTLPDCTAGDSHLRWWCRQVVVDIVLLEIGIVS